MKRGKKRVSVTEKMASETRGESYFVNWAMRMMEKQRTCECGAFEMAHRPDQCAEPRVLCTWDGQTGQCPGPCDCGS